MDKNNLHHLDKHVSDVLPMAGWTNLRQIRCDRDSGQSIPFRWAAWTMRLHYLMWLITALGFIMVGALFRGHEDLLAENARMEGIALIINQITIKQLGDITL